MTSSTARRVNRTIVITVAAGVLAAAGLAAATRAAFADDPSPRVAAVEVGPVAQVVGSAGDDSPSPSDGPTSDPAAGGPSSSSSPGDDRSSSSRTPSDDSSRPASDDSSDGSTAPAAKVPAGVTVQRARDIALATQSGTIEEIKLDSRHGRTVWRVELRSGSGQKVELDIDARSGAVLKREVSG